MGGRFNIHHYIQPKTIFNNEKGTTSRAKHFEFLLLFFSSSFLPNGYKVKIDYFCVDRHVYENKGTN